MWLPRHTSVLDTQGTQREGAVHAGTRESGGHRSRDPCGANPSVRMVTPSHSCSPWEPEDRTQREAKVTPHHTDRKKAGKCRSLTTPHPQSMALTSPYFTEAAWTRGQEVSVSTRCRAPS